MRERFFQRRRQPETFYSPEVEQLMWQAEGQMARYKTETGVRRGYNRDNARVLLQNFLMGMQWALSRFQSLERPPLSIGYTLPTEFGGQQNVMTLAYFMPNAPGYAEHIGVNFPALYHDSNQSLTREYSFYAFTEIPKNARVRHTLPQLYACAGVEEAIHYLAAHGFGGLSPLATPDETREWKHNMLKYFTDRAEMDALHFKSMFHQERYGNNPFAGMSSFLQSRAEKKPAPITPLPRYNPMPIAA